MKQFIGCDPGKSGHVVMIQDGKITKYRFPFIGKEYDIRGMLEIFLGFDPNNCHVVIEDVKALQGPMKAGNWSLSRGKTILEMCCIFLDLPMTMVHSKTWQKEIWQGIPKQSNTKDTTALAIRRLFPSVDFRKSERATTDDDGVMDALAIAEYCRRKFQ